MFDISEKVLRAEREIGSTIKETPLQYSGHLSGLTNSKVYLKCENLQHTGSFKVRGALNKLVSLTPAQKENGVVTASSGNHGAAIAFGLSNLNSEGKVFVPIGTPQKKINNIKQHGALIEQVGADCVQTENHARTYAQKHNQYYISPYNDIEIIIGQGTVGSELYKQLTQVETVFVPVGGGGLISGIAAYLKSVAPHVSIIGCLPSNSPVMAKSVAAGKIVTMKTKPTLSDATAGGIEENAITFDFCVNLVDDYILVSEPEIKKAILLVKEHENMLVEGAAGVALAGLIKHSEMFQGKCNAVILSGGNMEAGLVN